MATGNVSIFGGAPGAGRGGKGCERGRRGGSRIERSEGGQFLLTGDVACRTLDSRSDTGVE